MRELLIVYGTTEGQTRKIAQFLAEQARQRNFACEVHDAAEVPKGIDLERFDKIIVAASVHIERHQQGVLDFVRAHRKGLQAKSSAFLSVSLSAAGDAEERYEAWEYTRTFLAEADWQPAKVQIAAGALRFTREDFFKRWAMKRLAKEKRTPASTSEDYEYTDWADLTQFAKDFLVGGQQG